MKEQEITDLIRHRIEQARTALDDAEYLLNGNRSPQSIVNRAYYAMFYAALALLQKANKVPSKHAGVISLFDTEYVVPGLLSKDLSRDFHKAFELRQVSDYRNDPSFSIEKARDALKNARRFVVTISSYLNV